LIESDVSLVESVFGGVKASVLETLCREDKSVDDLSSMMHINKTAVNEHMDYLERKGYVKSFFRNSGRGRPRKYFGLTEKGYELFPKKYSLFASLIVETLEEEFGSDKVGELLDKVAMKILKSSSGDGFLHADASREDKIRSLESFVSTLNRLGYYARLEVSGDKVRIVRSNCIFYELAKGHSGQICGVLESDIIKRSTDADFTIAEKFTDGSRKCVIELDI
jgi:predicted ArsR family transcriptional regulator